MAFIFPRRHPWLMSVEYTPDGPVFHVNFPRYYRNNPVGDLSNVVQTEYAMYAACASPAPTVASAPSGGMVAVNSGPVNAVSLSTLVDTHENKQPQSPPHYQPNFQRLRQSTNQTLAAAELPELHQQQEAVELPAARDALVALVPAATKSTYDVAFAYFGRCLGYGALFGTLISVPIWSVLDHKTALSSFIATTFLGALTGFDAGTVFGLYSARKMYQITL